MECRPADTPFIANSATRSRNAGNRHFVGEKLLVIVATGPAATAAARGAQLCTIEIELFAFQFVELSLLIVGQIGEAFLFSRLANLVHFGAKLACLLLIGPLELRE